MNRIKINKISKRQHVGKVYNLHLESKDDNPDNDDLFWVEQRTGIVSHNCFTKDVSALIEASKKFGYEASLLREIQNSNERIGKIRKEQNNIRSE